MEVSSSPLSLSLCPCTPPPPITVADCAPALLWELSSGGRCTDRPAYSSRPPSFLRQGCRSCPGGKREKGTGPGILILEPTLCAASQRAAVRQLQACIHYQSDEQALQTGGCVYNENIRCDCKVGRGPFGPGCLILGCICR